MSVQLRDERSVVRFSGADATRLLGDVLTAPVSETEGLARWFALLAPQGKILAEGLIGWTDGAYWTDVHRDVAENFVKRMKMYRLRAAMEIEPLGEGYRVGWSAAPADGLCHADGRAEGLGYRVIAPVEAAGAWTQGNGQAAARVAEAIAEMGPDFDAEDIFPHDIAMDHLGGVDFKKGCYVGQEVVSRMQHRGTARRRPVIVSGLGSTAARGDAVTLGGKAIGTIGTPADGRAVAIVRIDKVGDPTAAQVNGTAATLALPRWASYRFAESGGESED